MKETIVERNVNVALLAEGVDRNFPAHVGNGKDQRSPSSRRAWIEIGKTVVLFMFAVVALLAEGVDRNRP